MKYIDITKPIFNGMKKYPSDPEVEVRSFKAIKNGDSSNLLKLGFGSHTGTHIDAPRHIFDGKKTIDKVNVESFICRAAVTDVKSFSEKTFLRKIKKEKIKGMLFKGEKDSHALTPDDAALAVKSGIKIIGTERMSIETSRDKSHPVHRQLLRRGIMIVENLNLKRVKKGFYKFICLPLKIKDGDASPVRAVLIYD